MRKPSENGRVGRKSSSDRRDKTPSGQKGKPSSSGFKKYSNREGTDEKKRFESDKKSGPAKERRFTSDRPSSGNRKTDRFDKNEKKEQKGFGGFERKGKTGPGKSFGTPRFSENKEIGKSFRGPRKEDQSQDRYTKKTFSGKSLKGPRKPEEKQDGDFSKPKYTRRDKSVRAPQVSKHQDGTIRLNRFLSNAGLASRREADVMIEAGLVKVNGKIVTELGTRVNPEIDEIQYGGERIRSEKKVYILVNKPKNIITTTDDPEGRNTVMELIRDFQGKERVFPVGRLDRNTTGVLLLTNDGELSNKLTHPRYGVKKVYIVTLDKPLKPADRHRLLEGVELEDGMVQADAVELKDEHDKTVVFFEIHSGKNRIVRRMFESIGYEVVKLDRTLFGGLSKAGLRRGQWRILDETEIVRLKKL